MEVDQVEWRRQERYLLAVAYRLLGSLTEAEDAVQEAYLRLHRAGAADVGDVRAWLATVVSRICVDQLRSARARRECYVGPWLPEPLVGDTLAPDPADRAIVAESVRMALLVVLECLTPAERTAFVLHDVFDMPFAQVGQVVGRGPGACRQLAFRARRHVRVHTPQFDVDADKLARIVSAFHTAAATGDVGSLVSLLDPDVVLRCDGGGKTPTAAHPVRGAEEVARLLSARCQQLRAVGQTARMVPVNGAPGLLFERDGTVAGVGAITVVGGRIIAIDLVVNPDKLRHLQRSAPPAEHGGPSDRRLDRPDMAAARPAPTP